MRLLGGRGVWCHFLRPGFQTSLSQDVGKSVSSQSKIISGRAPGLGSVSGASRDGPALGEAASTTRLPSASSLGGRRCAGLSACTCMGVSLPAELLISLLDRL